MSDTRYDLGAHFTTLVFIGLHLVFVLIGIGMYSEGRHNKRCGNAIRCLFMAMGIFICITSVSFLVILLYNFFIGNIRT